MKFDNLGKLVGDGAKVAGLPPGTGDWLSRVQSTIITLRDVLKIAKELRGEPAAAGSQASGQLPDYPQPKSLPAASNPALGKFLAKYGDVTLDEALKVLGPMTVKQIISMVQHGNRPGE